MPILLCWADFGAADTPLSVQAVFVHELTHVWQAQNGISLILAKLRAGDRGASYTYDLTRQPDFLALNIEQQAMVVEHAFTLSRGGKAPQAAELYAQAQPSWWRV